MEATISRASANVEKSVTVASTLHVAVAVKVDDHAYVNAHVTGYFFGGGVGPPCALITSSTALLFDFTSG